MKVKTIKVGELKTNCYIIIKNNKCLIVDPGDEYEKIKRELDDIKLCGILITHHHFDHVGALNQFKNDYKVKTYDYKDYSDDDKIISIEDFNFKMIETKGHSNDLVSFYFFEDELLFCGDFIFKETVGRCDLFGSDYNEMLKSIDKIKQYNKDIVVYPGHGLSTTLIHEINNNEYFN